MLQALNLQIAEREDKITDVGQGRVIQEAAEITSPSWSTCLKVLRHVWRPIVEFSFKFRRSKRHLKDLSNVIKKTQSSFELCLDDRKALQHQLALLNARQGRLANEAAFYKLPMELWSRIFLLCLPDTNFVVPNPRDSPLLLCRVCSPWRDVAIGTPLLWASLSISSQGWNVWKLCLETWLQRSANASLSLDISFPTYINPIADRHILQVIFSTAERWRHLRLKMSDVLLTSMLSSPLPNLHSLEISCDFSLLNLNVDASKAPNLRNISLLTGSIYPHLLQLPWDHLTHLSSKCWLNTTQHISLLRLCPRLESYSMHIVPTHTFPESEPLTHHHLSNLQVVAHISIIMGPVLSRLRLPSLSGLEFIVPRESPACGLSCWPKSHVLALIERSSCPLERICVRGLNMASESLEDAQKSIPSLRSLELL